MTRIVESDGTEIVQSPEAVFQFLSDFNNFQQLMPEQVTDWVSDTVTRSFNIKGMASLGMAMDSKTPNSEVKLSAMAKRHSTFSSIATYNPGATPTTSNLQLAFDADLNLFEK
ncbi:MAG: hypothetical protein IPL74_18920 [Bacteroidetes bacterium]|nr:hypothetical protein [Bacteroidota bacterium]